MFRVANKHEYGHASDKRITLMGRMLDAQGESEEARPDNEASPRPLACDGITSTRQ